MSLLARKKIAREPAFVSTWLLRFGMLVQANAAQLNCRLRVYYLKHSGACDSAVAVFYSGVD
jgi:hypothetical protein